MGPLRRDDPRDDVRLQDSPALAHLVPAIENGRRCTAGQLVAAPVVIAAPDPTVRLRWTHQSNPRHDGVGLRILTWNVALLDATLFGVIPYKKSPRMPERKPFLLERIGTSGADVVLLQEVWKDDDLAEVAATAEVTGFFCVHGPRRRYTDGVVTLVRKAIVRGGITTHAAPYLHSDPKEFFPGPRVRRAFVEVAFTHPALGPVRVLNTHLLAWAKNWRVRLRQARQLGLRAAHAPEDALVFVGGDLNAAPYYPRDTWVHPDGRAEPGWWGNALSWAVLQHYGGLVELGIRGAEDPLLDITLQDALRPDADGKVDVARFAALTQHPRHFTATDENRLYAEQYRGTEYPSRIDQVFARDPGGRVAVLSVMPRFAEVVPELGVEASDHVGVELDLRIRP